MEEEYMAYMKDLAPMSDDIYRYLNFHELAEYKDVADASTAVTLS